jgi:hypothetical protein
VYVGQTGRDFKTSYEEHVNDTRSNKDKAGYALCILQENYKYGPIEKTTDIHKVVNKGKQLDAYEKFYIYKATKRKQVMNQQHVVSNYVLFD